MSKTKYTIEFEMKGTPPSLLWVYLTTSSGLEQWFAEEVKQDGKSYHFYWDGYPNEAVLLSTRAGERAKFRWVEEDEKTHFEFKIQVSELTGNTLLVVTDFAEPAEEEGAKAVWTKQVKTLKRILGCL